MTSTLTIHGFTLDVYSDDTGAGFDVTDSDGDVFASEWLIGGTFEAAMESAVDYAKTEFARSGRKGVAA